MTKFNPKQREQLDAMARKLCERREQALKPVVCMWCDRKGACYADKGLILCPDCSRYMAAWKR